MLKELLSIFKGDSKLDEAYRQSYEMLDIAHDMFTESRRSLREAEGIDLGADIAKRDKAINKYERDVRKFVVQHLAVTGTEHMMGGLILVSVIVDIERLGDYAKNVVELAANHPEKLNGGDHEADLKRVEDAVEDTFTRMRNILRNSDHDEAENLLRDYLWVNSLCDRRVIDYIRDSEADIPVGTAVALALYFRYLKRINAHLQNIATSVCNPYHRIGFLPKDLKKELKAARKAQNPDDPSTTEPDDLD